MPTLLDEHAEVAAERVGTPADTVRSVDGLLALLVTDVEQFTAIVERLGDVGARNLMRAHNRLLRSCLSAHAGSEIMHTGDGVIAAFRSVARALSCAIQIQRELEAFSASSRADPLRVRMGVHAGEPLAEEGRLFGICVNTAVRVCSSAAASRVLVTDVVCQLAAGQPFAFAPLGVVALHGIEQPMQLSELLWDRSTCQV